MSAIEIEKLDLTRGDSEYELYRMVNIGEILAIPTELRQGSDGIVYNRILIRPLQDMVEVYHVVDTQLPKGRERKVPDEVFEDIEPVSEITKGGEDLDWIYKEGKTVEEIKITYPDPDDPPEDPGPAEEEKDGANV